MLKRFLHALITSSLVLFVFAFLMNLLFNNEHFGGILGAFQDSM